MPSYWSSDDVDESAFGNFERFIIGGTGDGALVDAFRILYDNFDGGKFLVKVAARFSSGRVAQAVSNAERNISRLNDDDDNSEKISVLYQKIVDDMNPQDRKYLTDHIRSNTRSRVVLVAPRVAPFQPSTAPIHKFLLAHLLLEGAISFARGRVIDALDGQVRVEGVASTFEVQETDKLILRLGPEVSLKTFLSEDNTKGPAG